MTAFKAEMAAETSKQKHEEFIYRIGQPGLGFQLNLSVTAAGGARSLDTQWKSDGRYPLLQCWISADGLRWRKLREEPILRFNLYGVMDGDFSLFWSQPSGAKFSRRFHKFGNVFLEVFG
jgi:hypothetical protein